MGPDVYSDPKGAYHPIATTDSSPVSPNTPMEHVHVPLQLEDQPGCLERWLRGDFTINPDGNSKASVMLDGWDIVVISALVTTAVAVPFQVAIMETPSEVDILMGKVTDMIFTVDIILTFNVAIIVEDTANPSREAYERSPIAIARRYMAWPFSDNFQAGWFWPDVLTIMPWDLLTVGINAQQVRLIRVVRLLRMLRLVRVMKLFKRWRTRTGTPNSVIRIIGVTSVTLLLVHWLACFWCHLGLQPVSTGSNADVTWLSNHLTEGTPIESLTPLQIYENALYLCIVVLTSVGFGDITPTNGTEEQCMIITLLFTGVTWSWVVANVVAVITSMDVFGAIFHQIMDDLNNWMESHHIDPVLKLKIRRHVHEAYKIQREIHHREAFGWLSTGLQGELAMQSGVGEVCQRIWYLRDLPEEVMIELAEQFKGVLFSPSEVIMDQNCANVIVRGTCIRRGKMLWRNAVFGEDIILVSDKLRDTTCPRSVTFVEVSRIHRDSLRQAASKFPVFDTRLRRAQMKLALWRSFVRTAEERKAAEALRSSENGVAQRQSAWQSSFFDAESAAESRKVKKDSNKHLTSWAKSMDEREILVAAPSVSDESCVRILDEIRKLSGSCEEARWASDRQLREMGDRVQAMETRLKSIDSRIEEVAAKQDAAQRTPPAEACATPSSSRMNKNRKTFTAQIPGFGMAK